MKSISGVAIRAVACAVPTKIVTTDEYSVLTPEERQRLEKATGVGKRRISPLNQCASDLCAAAANHAIETLGWQRDSIGALVLITQTADQPIPATSIVLQAKLGLSQAHIAFDVNLGCSAMPFGLAIVGSMMQALNVPRALLLMGDVSSRVCAEHDKSSWPLFGDAGSAVALELQDDAPAMYFDLMSDGSGKDAIIVPSGGLASRRPPGPGPVEEEVGSDGIPRRPDNLHLRGADVFSFAISKVPSSILRALETSGKSVENLDYLVLHQANKMINDTIAKKVKMLPEKSLSSLGDYGNTSSASIPLTLCAHASKFSEGDRLVSACGFGVGLSWGTAVLTIPAGSILPIVESDNVY
jgi:3-oxoacyl-[acyl-carrier-protein] synthase-3